MKKESLSSKQILIDIFNMNQIAVHLLGKGKAHDDLLRHILSENFLSDEGKPLPTLKELATATGLTYEKVKLQLNEIYQELLHQENPSLYFDFQHVEYIFNLKYLDKQHSFTVKQLPVVPRVGEQVWVYFFRAIIPCDIFHVKRVDHMFDGNKQEVQIDLTPMNYNLYWHYRLDQTLAEQDITFGEYLLGDEEKLKQKLGVIPKRWDNGP